MSRLRQLGFNSLISLHINNCLEKNIFRTYAFKSDLKIKWVRPEKIPCYKPEKSGDLQNFPDVDKKQIRLEFQNSEELQTANDEVKKLFTLEFAPKKYTNQLVYNDLTKTVKRHEFDYSSVEVKIARWTGIIRAQQEHFEKFPKNIRLKVAMKELIDKRKKHLKYLRRWDYKKFEWLLETLNLEYKPPPSEYYPVTRKDSLRKLTDKYCNSIKEERLKTYRLKLESEQPAFLEEKIRCLQFIRDEQKSCGVEVTVTEDEINKVKKQLEDLKKKNEELNKDDN